MFVLNLAVTSTDAGDRSAGSEGSLSCGGKSSPQPAAGDREQAPMEALGICGVSSAARKGLLQLFEEGAGRTDLPLGPDGIGPVALAASGGFGPCDKEGHADPREQAQSGGGRSRTHMQFVLQATDVEALMTFAFNAPMIPPGGQHFLGAEVFGWPAGDQMVAEEGRFPFFRAFPDEQTQLGCPRQAKLCGRHFADDQGALFDSAILGFGGLRDSVEARLGRRLLRGKNPPAGEFGLF